MQLINNKQKLILVNKYWDGVDKPEITPPEEKPTRPNRQIPEYPGKTEEKPTSPNPDIPEIKPQKNSNGKKNKKSSL